MLGWLQFCQKLCCVLVTHLLTMLNEMGLHAIYALKIVLSDARAFLCFKRSRVYVYLVCRRTGGQATADRAARYMSVSTECILEGRAKR